MVADTAPTLDLVFHALAHPARRAMLRQLSQAERSLSELAAPLKMTFQAASKHVRVLERARLVSRRVEGRTHVCAVRGDTLSEASEWLVEYREAWEQNFQRLDALLSEMQAPAAKTAPTAKGRRRTTKRR